MQEYPLITIGVSTYNRKDFLQASLDSLLAQTYPNCEIIVIDDGSTDGTENMMREKYPQIQYVKKENGGDASAKNMATMLAKGEYIVFNDSDDIFLPDAVERLYKAVSTHPDSIGYGSYITIDKDGNRLSTRSKVSHLPSGRITGALIQHIVVNNCGTLFPAHLLKESSRYDTRLRCSYDYKLILELSLQCEFIPVQEPVFLRRRHSSNLSSVSYAKQKIVLDVLEEFLQKYEAELTPYKKIIRQRRADLHNKLAKAARKEGDRQRARSHLKTALQYSFTWKAFFRYLFF